MTHCFDDFELDTERFELRRAGTPVPVEPQVFEVLAHLVRHHGRLVTKEELLDGVWGDRFVSESALSSRIKSARRAVGDDGSAQRLIATVHGRGFRFVAPVEEQLGISQGAAVATAFAARNPHRVSRLVLYGGYAMGRQARARSEQELREAEMVLDVVESGWGRDTSLFRQMIAAQFMPEGTTEQWDAFDAFQRLTTSAQNARRLLTVAARIDVTEVATQVQAPTLVLHADDDRRVPVEQAARLAHPGRPLRAPHQLQPPPARRGAGVDPVPRRRRRVPRSGMTSLR